MSTFTGLPLGGTGSAENDDVLRRMFVLMWSLASPANIIRYHLDWRQRVREVKAHWWAIAPLDDYNDMVFPNIAPQPTFVRVQTYRSDEVRKNDEINLSYIVVWAAAIFTTRTQNATFRNCGGPRFEPADLATTTTRGTHTQRFRNLPEEAAAPPADSVVRRRHNSFLLKQRNLCILFLYLKLCQWRGQYIPSPRGVIPRYLNCPKSDAICSHSVNVAWQPKHNQFI